MSCNGCDENSAQLPIGPPGSDVDQIFEIGSGDGSIQTKDNGADASNTNSLSIGVNTEASGQSSVALGDTAKAKAINTIAIGSSSWAGTNTCISIGTSATSTIISAIAIGTGANSDGTASIAIGDGTGSSGNNSLCIGAGSSTALANANAIGANAVANITKTTQLNGTLITKKDNGESDYQLEYSSGQVTITSPEIDFKGVSDITIVIPTGSKFYVDGVDVILTSFGSTITIQPTIRVGTNGTPALFYAAALTSFTSGLFNREKLTLINSAATRIGQQTVTCGVTIVGACTGSFKGRFVFKGYLLENE
jgi:Head domain of trimeric autotransporter adhesin